MIIQNILIAGNFQTDFDKYFPNKDQKELRFIPIEAITSVDLAWADVYVGFKPCPTFQISQLKWVHSFNAGVNNFLEFNGWKDHKVLLTRTVCSFGERISEYCLSYVLKHLQYHKEFQQRQLEKKWIQKTPGRLKDQTIVVFGTGAIGQEVARAFSIFGCNVIGVSISGAHKEHFQKVVQVQNSATVIGDADWIISTLPLTSQTVQLFNHKMFRQMKGSGFINVGRGATVQEEALIAALETGNIHTAVLDVVEKEPLPVTSPWWEREDVTITPHISAITEMNEAIKCFYQTLLAIEADQPLVNQVDFNKGY